MRGPSHRRRPLHRRAACPGSCWRRAWWLAAGVARCAGGSVELAEPTPEGTRRRCSGRRSTDGGCGGWVCCSGVAGVIGSVVLLAEASVFLWVPVLVRRPARGRAARRGHPARARAGRPPSRPGARAASSRSRAGWSGRCAAVVAAELVAGRLALAGRRAAGRRRPGRRSSSRWPAWLLAEVALLRALLRPLPARGRRRARRRGAAHLDGAPGHRRGERAGAAARWAPCCCAAGIDPDRVTEGVDLLPVALVAGGLLGAGGGHRGGRLPADLAAPGAGQRARPGRLTAAGSDTRVPLEMHGPDAYAVAFVTGTGVTFPGVPRASPGTSVTEGVGAPTLSALRASASLAVHSCQLAPCSLSCRDRQPGWRPTRAAFTGLELRSGPDCRPSRPRDRRAVLGRRARSPARVL